MTSLRVTELPESKTTAKTTTTTFLPCPNKPQGRSRLCEGQGHNQGQIQGKDQSQGHGQDQIDHSQRLGKIKSYAYSKVLCQGLGQGRSQG